MKQDSMGSILLVDDNEQNLQVLAGVLSNSGYDFAMEMDGPSAIKFAKEMKPDLILLDIMMPDMDGYEVCQVLKNDVETKDIPIIFLTAKTGIEDLVKGFQFGAVDYLTKPFRKEELIARVNTHLDLVRTKRFLTDSNNTKNLLFSIIAHDLRGNIGVLYSWFLILTDKSHSISKEYILETIDQLFTTVESTYLLLENLLEWSREQRDQIVLETMNTNIKSVFDEVYNMVSEAARKKNITISFNINENQNAYFDAKTISTVIRNLLSNSIKFTPEGGNISVTTNAKNNLLEVSIADSGVGMSEAKLKKLFSTREVHSTKGTMGEKGTGLGLLLCKDFVEKNNGKIWAKSEEKKGTTFYFTLPLEESESDRTE